MLGLRAGYAAAAVAVFGLELFIALTVEDRIIRPFGGDSLAVVLVYLVLRAASRIEVLAATALAFAIACAVEIAQWLDLLDTIGLRGNPIARVVLGASFDPMDLAAYALGAVLILVGESLRRAIRRRAPG
ncbi:DUF2809 domain-containing protein [Allosphingosinicella deserti]|uniref:DUF2809 domain-containing protein n=1 Tax=Allosphingosinicella deserti TaxID=2116704 RepID=A0A2P7R045_9SPHN|nr:DUF2809 domain-containing protein [Sphingomonas deserti]PSJ43592.1 DUF2809 domain-containing protein [Sphingomonas deserti]